MPSSLSRACYDRKVAAVALGSGCFVVITLILYFRFYGSVALLPCYHGSAEAVDDFLGGFAGCDCVIKGDGGSGSRGGCTRLPCCGGGGLDAVSGIVGALSGFREWEVLVTTIFFPSGAEGSPMIEAALPSLIVLYRH